MTPARQHVRTPAGRSSAAPRAFTLLELLVVVALLGLAAAALTVQLSGLTERARLRAAALDIEQTLRLARHQAAKTRQPVWLQFTRGTGRYRLVWAGAMAPTPGGWRVLEHVTLAGAEVPGTSPAAAGLRPVQRDETFTLRLSPSGTTLPFALELHAGQLRRVVWTDGISGHLAYRDGVGLRQFDWPGTVPEVPR